MQNLSDQSVGKSLKEIIQKLGPYEETRRLALFSMATNYPEQYHLYVITLIEKIRTGSLALHMQQAESHNKFANKVLELSKVNFADAWGLIEAKSTILKFLIQAKNYKNK